jgi:HEAT repeat protein
MLLVRQHEGDGGPRENRAYPRDRDGLVRALADASPEARRWAARDLAAYPDAAEALVTRLAAEPSPAVQQAIATTLIAFGTTAAAVGLLPLLRSEDAAIRNLAVEALQQMPDAVAPHMEDLLSDADADVRLLAVDILHALRHPRTAEWLYGLIERDPSINVCASAIDRLAEAGGPEGVPLMRSLTERFPDEPFLDFAIHMAVERIEGGRTE